MPIQLALSFDAVPDACEVQQRYFSKQGWTETRIAGLLHISRKTERQAD
jgi:hypothetical protein